MILALVFYASKFVLGLVPIAITQQKKMTDSIPSAAEIANNDFAMAACTGLGVVLVSTVAFAVVKLFFSNRPQFETEL